MTDQTAQPSFPPQDSSPTPSSTSYQIYPAFPGTSPAAPFLLPPGGWTFNKPIPVSIPGLRQVSSQSSCTAPGNSDFTFTWQDTDASVTIEPANAWSGSPTARQTLLNSFNSLISQVECLEITDGLIVSGGTFLLAQQVADALPKGLDEMLVYACSFNSGAAALTTPYVDLQPGMRLRIEVEGQQYEGPGKDVQIFNGFVGTGRFIYDIVGWTDSTGKRCIGFDRFLSTIVPPSITPVTEGSPAAGVIDLQARTNQRRYARLFYPSAYIPPDSPGDQSLETNVAIIQADTLADLQTATTAYMQQGTCAPASSVECFIFRGRVIAIPEIPIWLQFGPASMSGKNIGASQQLVYFPIGTTVGDVAARCAIWNTGAFNLTSTPPITVQRVSSNQNPFLPRLYPVSLPTGTPAAAVNGLFTLPLLRGDSIIFWLA